MTPTKLFGRPLLLLFLVTPLLALSPVTAVAADGHALYRQHCLSCHQADGWGIPFQAAPLNDSPIVAGSPAPLIDFVLEGTINRADFPSEYEALMPGFATLGDEELAAILNYIRTAFAERSADVNAGLVAEQRLRGHH
jgi:mono/diheme cytochrome c family protein